MASSDAKNDTKLAMSSGWPIRFNGIDSIDFFNNSSSTTKPNDLAMFVSTGPALKFKRIRFKSKCCMIHILDPVDAYTKRCKLLGNTLGQHVQCRFGYIVGYIVQNLLNINENYNTRFGLSGVSSDVERNQNSLCSR